MNMNDHEHDEMGADEASDLNSALSPTNEVEFVTEEKKPMNRGTMLLFAIVLAGAVGTYFMYLRTGPQAATAAVSEEAEAAQATISQFLDSGSSRIQSMESMLSSTEKMVQQFLAYPSATQVPLEELRTNPFRHLFAKAATDDGNVASRRRQEQERDAIVKAAGGLQLQSVLASGTRRSCMINNTLYTEGQTVEGFTIEQISPSGVVVRNGPYRVQLSMQK